MFLLWYIICHLKKKSINRVHTVSARLNRCIFVSWEETMKRFVGMLLGLLLLGLLLLLPINSIAAIVFGIIYDKDTEDPLVGANVVLVGTSRGAATDLNGGFRIVGLKAGTYKFQVSMIGYHSKEVELTLVEDKDTRLTLGLEASLVKSPEVVVSAERIVEGTSVSDITLTNKKLRSRDGLLQDPIKVLLSMPGVAAAGDLFSPSQLYVRGGSPEENLFLMDQTQVHWPWYSGGMKSIF